MGDKHEQWFFLNSNAVMSYRYIHCLFVVCWISSTHNVSRIELMFSVPSRFLLTCVWQKVEKVLTIIMDYFVIKKGRRNIYIKSNPSLRPTSLTPSNFLGCKKQCLFVKHFEINFVLQKFGLSSPWLLNSVLKCYRMIINQLVVKHGIIWIFY